MKDSVIDFFKSNIDHEKALAKERMANGVCSTLQEYQYEVTRIRTLDEAVELLRKAVKNSYNSNMDD